MVDLPKKKVGIVACSGEEMAEGAVTRLAALKVLEHLRPADTVTICLPLFLAGGEGDRAFARFYPTIAIDGCELRCAARATELYSGKPAASIVVTELVEQGGMEKPQGMRRLDEAGTRVVDSTAERIVEWVDELLGKKWSRSAGNSMGMVASQEAVIEQPEPVEATCSCGSNIPVRKLMIGGQQVTIVGLPLIFEQFRQTGKPPVDGTAGELLEMVKIYNPVPEAEEETYARLLLDEYAVYCKHEEMV
jgi:uncharacterized metal-binding protein